MGENYNKGSLIRMTPEVIILERVEEWAPALCTSNRRIYEGSFAFSNHITNLLCKKFQTFSAAAAAVTVIAFFVLKRTSGYVHAAAAVVQHFASHKRNYDLTS